MLDREKVVGAPGVFVIIAAFKLRAEWESVDEAIHERAAEELTRVLTRSARQVCTDIYLSRGLKASSDYFLRVHAHCLAEAQSYLEDCGGTTVGRFSQVTEILVGLTKPRQYITRERSARLDKEVNSTPYDGGAPRFAIVIPVKKNAQWWNMPESERLREVELHTQKSIPYLPHVKRALYHSTGMEEIDFITYFETADLKAFHELSVALAGIRESEFQTPCERPILLGTIHSAPDVIGVLCRQNKNARESGTPGAAANS